MAGSLESFLDGGGGEVESGWEFGGPYTFLVAQLERLPERRRQGIDAGAEGVEFFVEGIAGEPLELGEAVVEEFQSRGRAGTQSGGFLAAVRQDESAGDAAQPGTERPGPIVLIDLAPGGEHGFLEQVVGHGVVAHHGPQVDHQHVGMLTHEDFEQVGSVHVEPYCRERAKRGQWPTDFPPFLPQVTR